MTTPEEYAMNAQASCTHTEPGSVCYQCLLDTIEYVKSQERAYVIELCRQIVAKEVKTICDQIKAQSTQN